ncbi:MAG: RNA-binding cell elongation regulator Jag/EloR [Armatimonadota bacterium]
MAISIEKTGRTFEEAKRAALEELGVPEDRISIEILEDRAKGFLGLSGRQVRIRVTTLDDVPVRVGASEERDPKRDVDPMVIARDLLREILSAMGLKASVEARKEPDRIVLDIQGPDVAILIGHHGQTLNALQYLLYVMVSRKMHGKVSLLLDAEGYRQRREQALRRLALELAKKVRETGQEAVMDAMPPAERRVIHLALVNEPGVTTYSEGEEPDRHIVISPID